MGPVRKISHRPVFEIMENWLLQMIEKTGMVAGYEKYIYWAIVVVGIIILFYLSSFACRKVVTPIIRVVTKKTRNNWDDILLNEKAIRNACNLVPAIILAILLPLAITPGTLLFTIASRLCWVYITALGVRLICIVLSSLYIITNSSERTKNHTLQGVFQMLKILAICVGAIIIVAILINRDPSMLLTGLGASAAVLMLVFKDSIMGLVAGVQLSANDMLRPGDWIQMPKYGADGDVIDVSLTTVKVQNWDKTITTIPPYALVSESFQNWRGMVESGGRRIKRSIYIDMNSICFCNAQQMKSFEEKGFIKDRKMEQTVNITLFREWLEEWLRNHPRVNRNMTLMVRQLQPTPQGMPLELYFFFNGTAWVPYEKLQSEVFEYILAILPEFGLKAFQSPSGCDFWEQESHTQK